MLLYKYFPAHRYDFFYRPCIRFTPLQELNDPFECRSILFEKYHPERIDELVKSGFFVTDEYIVSKIPELKGKKSDELVELSNKILENNIRKSCETKNDNAIKEGKRVFDLLNSMINFGVFSLTEVYDSLLMWAHYSSSHAGFVVEFDVSNDMFLLQRINIFEKIRKVICRKDRPYIYHIDKHAIGRHKQNEISDNLYMKSLCWKYEKEWRMVALRIGEINKLGLPGLVDIKSRYIKSIMLGMNVDSRINLLAQEFCRSHPEISLFRAKLHEKQYALMFEEVQL